ncbi:MAG: sarcosine oxidase subunit gamma [Pseudomonadota bacterium]
MADFTLTSEPPLAGTQTTRGSVRLSAPESLAIVSVALPLGQEKPACSAIESAFKLVFPDPGQSTVAQDGTRLVRTGPDQALLIFEWPTPDAESHVASKLKGKAYTTDQTDVWVALALEGPDCRAVLERICPIDLDPTAFAENDAARTMMEHLGVLIVSTGKDSFLLLSASSSARTFLHALETSMFNALGEGGA